MSESSTRETAKCRHQLLPRYKARARRGVGELTERAVETQVSAAAWRWSTGKEGKSEPTGGTGSSSQRTSDIMLKREKRLSEAKEHQAWVEADFTWEHQPQSWQIWRSPDRRLSGVRWRILEAMWEESKKRGVEEITEDKWPPFPASQILAEIYLIHQKQQQQQKNRPMHQPLYKKS